VLSATALEARDAEGGEAGFAFGEGLQHIAVREVRGRTGLAAVALVEEEGAVAALLGEVLAERGC